MKRLPWWQIPAIVVGSTAALGAVGTLAVNYALFANLPQRVEAGEAKNEQQDKQLDRLITLQEFYANQQPPVAPRPRASGIREWSDDDETFWCCPKEDREACWEPVNLWRRCK